jgi:putative oxidoreductase
MRLAHTALRTIIGALFIGHGTQKLFGWFGGPGIDATGETFERLGLRPGRRHAIAAGAAETGGGTLFVLGLANPLAAALVSGTMLTAIRRVHARNGPWVTNGGFEYNVVLIAAALVLAAPRSAPDDARSELKWALASLGAGAAGAAGAELIARREEQDGEIQEFAQPESAVAA